MAVKYSPYAGQTRTSPRLAKIVLAVTGVFVVTVIFLIPKLRSTLWRETLAATQPPVHEETQPIELTEADAAQLWSPEDLAPEDETKSFETTAEPGGDADLKAPIGIRTVRVLPRSESELSAYHGRNRAEACEPLQSSQPVRLTSYTAYLTYRDTREYATRTPPPTTRRHVLSVGLDMLSTDQRDLPKLTRGRILGYLKENYLSVQARVRKDPDTGTLYLHHRPVAATVRFRGLPLTQDFIDPVAASIKDMRSLGLFLEDGEEPIPKNLRTLVIAHKAVWAVTTNARTTLDPRFEFVLIRARDTGSDQLDLHAFVTIENRTQLHYVRPSEQPLRPDDCCLKATVNFIEFSHAGLYPTVSVTRRTSVKSNATYLVADLDKYAREQGWSGTAFDHLNKTLDAIIDRKITPSTP